MVSTRKEAVRQVGTSMSDALARLRREEITVSEYLDFRADRAVEHLKGLVAAEHLDVVRATVREALTTDPVLAETVRQVTAPATHGVADR